MTQDEHLRDHERRLYVLEQTMNGTVKDGEKIDGVMDTLQRHNIYLVGDSRVPTTGLVQAVEKLTSTVKVGTAVLATLQVVFTIGWMIFTHFHK